MIFFAPFPYSLLQPIPAYFSLFQPIPAYSSLFQPFPAYSSLPAGDISSIVRAKSADLNIPSQGVQTTNKRQTTNSPIIEPSRFFRLMAGLGGIGKSELNPAPPQQGEAGSNHFTNHTYLNYVTCLVELIHMYISDCADLSYCADYYQY